MQEHKCNIWWNVWLMISMLIDIESLVIQTQSGISFKPIQVLWSCLILFLLWIWWTQHIKPIGITYFCLSLLVSCLLKWHIQLHLLYIEFEKEDNVNWVVHNFLWFFESPSNLPKIIVTNSDSALMNVVAKFFPSATPLFYCVCITFQKILELYISWMIK